MNLLNQYRHEPRRNRALKQPTKMKTCVRTSALAHSGALAQQFQINVFIAITLWRRNAIHCQYYLMMISYHKNIPKQFNSLVKWKDTDTEWGTSKKATYHAIFVNINFLFLLFMNVYGCFVVDVFSGFQMPSSQFTCIQCMTIYRYLTGRWLIFFYYAIFFSL